jgi:hypothetical protein
LKLIFLLGLILLLSSCEENIQSYDDLSADEQLYIRTRARVKCMAETEDDILDIIETSSSALLAYTRLDTWKLEYSKNNALIETSKIYVWKISGSTVYFLVSYVEAGTTSSKFVKFTNTVNSEMFQDLRTKKCDKDLTLSISPSLLTGTILEGPTTIDDNSYYKVTNTYSYTNPYPSFFGLINKKRVKKIYNDDTDTVTSTETYNYVITRITDVASLDTDYTDDTLYPNKKYCVVDYTAAVPNVYPLPNASDFGLSCTTNTSPGPDPDGDTVENFDSLELAI